MGYFWGVGVGGIGRGRGKGKGREVLSEDFAGFRKVREEDLGDLLFEER